MRKYSLQKVFLCAVGCLTLVTVPSNGAPPAAAATGTLQTRDPRYRLQPNDVLEIKYRYTPEYNQEVTIQPDNFVNLNLVGDLKAGGLTLSQFRGAVLDVVSARLREPELNVVLKSF